MKKTIIPFICTALLLGANGCETTEKIDDFPLRPSSMVVNCYFSPDQSWEFQVSKSLSVLDNADLKLLGNVRVKLFGNGELLTEINAPDSDGWYRSASAKPEPGKEYRIEVASPDFSKILRASGQLPPKVEITGANLLVKDSSFYQWTDQNGTVHVQGNLEGSFVIRFQDLPGEPNYYELSVHYLDSTNEYQNPDLTQVYQETLFLSSGDASVDYGGDGSTNLLLSDQVFDGQEYQLKVDFKDWNATRKKKYFIRLLSLGYQGYFYKQTIAAYRAAVNDPFAGPVQVFTNIENGSGIFAGCAVSVFEVQIN